MPAFMKPLVPAPLLEVIILDSHKPLFQAITKAGIGGISLKAFPGFACCQLRHSIVQVNMIQ